MSSDKKRVRQVMIVQQTNLLKFTKKELTDKLIKESQTRKNFEWAMIEHNQDTSESGTHAENHIHIIMRTGKGAGLTLAHWEDLIDVPVNQVDIWSGQWNNAIAYIFHRTTGASDKHPYAIDEADGNIDFKQALKDGHNQSIKTNENEVRLALEKLDAGVSDFNELADSLLGEDKVAFLRKAKDILSYQTTKPKPWHPIYVTYIYGKSGTGKTRLARYQAKDNVYVTSSTRDPFGKYNSENSVIIDDIRGKMMEAGELLRLLDPYNDQRVAPARYNDKDLRAVEQFFITNIASPFEFWKFNYSGEPFEQFRRRLTSVIQVFDDGTYEVQETKIRLQLPWEDKVATYEVD